MDSRNMRSTANDCNSRHPAPSVPHRLEGRVGRDGAARGDAGGYLAEWDVLSLLHLVRHELREILDVSATHQSATVSGPDHVLARDDEHTHLASTMVCWKSRVTTRPLIRDPDATLREACVHQVGTHARELEQLLTRRWWRHARCARWPSQCALPGIPTSRTRRGWSRA